jgi:hypothetical protein
MRDQDVAVKKWNRSLVGVAAALTVVVLTAGTASAQQPPTTDIEPGHWTVTPMLGFGSGGDLNNGALGVGIAGGYNWSSQIGLELAFTLLPSNDQGDLVDIETSVWNLTGDLSYHFTRQPTVPYAVVGFGMARADTNDADAVVINGLDFEAASTELILNFGAGLERAIAENANVRGDVRYYTGNDLVPDFLRVFAGVTFDLGEELTD